MRSINSLRLRLPAAALLLLAATPNSHAQSSGVLTVAEPAKLSVKRAATAEAKLSLTLREGYHLNSNEPSDKYLIPLKLTWEDTLLKTEKVEFPKPLLQKFEFSETPLSVYEGAFEIRTVFQAPPKAAPGPAIVTGKLRYQACSNTACLPPKTLEVRLPVVVQ
jgi:hypothetical protein